MDEVPFGLIAPLLVIYFVLLVVALVDCIRRENTNGPKVLWILIILLISILGPILYFVIGRKEDAA